MDRLRILSRLRSRHAIATRKTVGKPGLPALLSKTINDPSIRASGESAKAKVAKARSQTAGIVEAFDQLERAYDVGYSSLSEEKLVKLLTQAHEFDTENLQAALQSPSLIDPGLVTFLPQAISKLGRYYGITCDLIDAARSSQYTIFRRIAMEVLGEPPLDTQALANGLLNFDGALERITSTSCQTQFNHYNSESRSIARTRYQARISNRLSPWKVHAEIQLLFFYELNADIPRPRFICSSKSACYLCDLFVKSHGKFCLPRTHGRLYDRWILPEQSVHQPFRRHQSIQEAIDRFNSALESKIFQTLGTERASLHHPNESVLHLREPWSSNSTLPALETRQICKKPSDYSMIRLAKGPDAHIPGASANDDVSSETAFGQRNMKSGETFESVTPISSQTVTEEQRSMSPSNLAVTPLSHGETLCHRLSRACDTLVVHTDAITLHASWDGTPINVVESASGASITQDVCWVQVKWLSHGSHIPGSDQNVDCVHLETLGSTSDSVQEVTFEGGSARSQKALSVQNGRHVLEIQYYFEDPTCRWVLCSSFITWGIMMRFKSVTINWWST